MLELNCNDVLLDYGGGDGHLIRLASEAKPCSNYFLLEPSDNMREARATLAGIQNVTFCSNSADLADSMFSKISCLEVFEHVEPASSLDSVIRDIYRCLRPNGTLVVSMPVEVGPVSLLKNIFRIIAKSTFPGTNLKSMCLSAIGCVSSIPRTNGHIGFDYRSTLKLLLNAGFEMEQMRFTPIGFGGGVCNSQAHYRFRRPAR